MTSTVESKTSYSLLELRNAADDLLLLDVRTPAEFRERHVQGSILHPITDLAPQTVKELAKGKTACVVICASGNRASMAAAKLRNSGLDAVYVLEGGVQAWVTAGFPIVRGKATMSLERQVRVAAGTLVAAGCLMAYFISLTWLILPGFIGSGLVFAGITDTCTLGMLMARMPWNK
jgi:rhodanese-related sulfurtransferase